MGMRRGKVIGWLIALFLIAGPFSSGCDDTPEPDGDGDGDADGDSDGDGDGDSDGDADSDDVAPVVSITSPANNSIVTTRRLSIVGTAQDDSAISELLVNGVPAESTDGYATWQADLRLEPGPGQAIVVSATDEQGNTDPEAARITVSVEITGPDVVITSPGDGAVLNQARLAVNGTAVHNVGITSLRVNGIEASSGDAFATWSAEIDLLEGAGQDIQVDVTDTEGDVYEAADIVAVTVDLTPPTTTISSPAEGAILGDHHILVQGTASDDLSGLASVLVNGEAAVPAGESETLDAWQAEIIVSPAADQEIVVAVTDVAGNTSAEAARVVVSIDSGAPVVSITSPAEGTTVIESTVTVAGSVETLQEVARLIVGGVEATSTSENFATWTAAVTLDDGPQTLTADIESAYGTFEDVATVSFLVDTSAPEAFIVTPGDGDIFTSTTVRVEGSASDLSAITSVEVNGVAATPVGGDLTSWTATVILAEGEGRTITVGTLDEHGHENPAAVTIAVDVVTDVPAVAITSPANGAQLTSTDVHVEGTAEFSLGITGVTVNGVAASPTAGGTYLTWAADITLEEGRDRLISVNATDETGRESEGLANIRVHVDASAPTAEITTPAADADLPSHVVMVRGTADDASGVEAVTVNDVAARATAPGFATWEVTLTLDDGAQPLVVATTDRLGNHDDEAARIMVNAPLLSQPWWDLDFRYRVQLTVTPGPYGPLLNPPIFQRVDFDALLADLELDGDVDRNSIRVIDEDGEELSSAVPAWYDASEGLLWFNPMTELEEEVEAVFHVYFETTDNPQEEPDYPLSPPPDVAMAYQDATIVRIIGDYRGNFRIDAGIPHPGSGSHNSQAIADFDNDGDWDYVISRQGDSAVYFAENRGGGDGFSNFEPLIQIGNRNLSLHCMGMVAGDFDEDGFFDFAAESDGRQRDDFQLFLGRGDGTFASPSTILRDNTSHGPRGLDVGDIDQDGDLDIVQGRNGSSCWWYWFPGRGDGRFFEQRNGGQHTPCNNDDAYGMALGDFNDDGRLDLLQGTAYYSLNNTAASFYDGGVGGYSRIGNFPYHRIWDGSRENVHGWWKAFDFDHDGDEDLIGHMYCDNITACAGVYFWERDSTSARRFAEPERLGGTGTNWMGQGVTSPARGHNINYDIALADPEMF
jgi:hypothetical protein